MRDYENSQKNHPYVGLSRQKIYEVQYQQQYVLVVTDIDFVITFFFPTLDGLASILRPK